MEKRKEERLVIRIPMEITTSSLPVPMPIISDNFCPGGAHLCPTYPIKLDEHIICQFDVPGIDNTFVYDSRVVYKNKEDELRGAAKSGFGVEFINAPIDEQQTIRQALWDLTGWYGTPLF